MFRLLVLGIGLIATLVLGNSMVDYMSFPRNFAIGIASSSHQIEGGWNASGKGVNVWDKFTHETPWKIHNNSNADVTADFYHKYQEDILLLKDLGVDTFRLSLSWSRILPTGFANNISEDGIEFYKNLLNGLNSVGIEPLVTIYHWDHPVVLEEMGGWTNEMMITWFADYARVVFEHLGSEVKNFATLNEPALLCNEAYGSGIWAPGKEVPGVAPYLCMHNMLKAHARVYKMYDTEYRKEQGGVIGIALSMTHYYPKTDKDDLSAEAGFAFESGWAGDPIFSANGDYPDLMKQRVAENSKMQGYPKSRLPEFSPEEIEYIKGSADYLGLNHYTSVLAEPAPKANGSLWYRDSGVILSPDPKWPTTISSWLTVVPQGFGDLLRLLKERYGNPPIYVLENGVSDGGSNLDDQHRVEYLASYLKELLLATNRDGCDIRGYMAWSFLDSFEWNQGYRETFGFVRVNFNDPDRPRTPKKSYRWYQNLIKTRRLPAMH